MSNVVVVSLAKSSMSRIAYRKHQAFPILSLPSSPIQMAFNVLRTTYRPTDAPRMGLFRWSFDGNVSVRKFLQPTPTCSPTMCRYVGSVRG